MRRRLFAAVLAATMVLVLPGVANAAPIQKYESENTFHPQYIECMGEHISGTSYDLHMGQQFTDNGGNQHAVWVQRWTADLVGEDSGTRYKMFRQQLEVRHANYEDGRIITIIPEPYHLVPVGGPGPVLLWQAKFTYMVINGELLKESWEWTVSCVGPEPGI